jgi:hypothetical protein
LAIDREQPSSSGLQNATSQMDGMGLVALWRSTPSLQRCR